MEKSDLTLSTYVQHVEDFRFGINVAGRSHRLPDNEIAKCFVSGLKPDILREEMYSRSFDTLDVIREAREELSTYRDILEISKRIKKVVPKKVFSKPRKDFPQRFQILKGGRKYFFSGGVSWWFQKIRKFKFKDR